MSITGPGWPTSQFCHNYKITKQVRSFQTISPSLFLTFRADRTVDYLEVVEGGWADSPLLLFVPRTEKVSTEPAVVPRDSLPSPLLALQVERLTRTGWLEDTGEGSRLPLQLPRAAAGLGELDVRRGWEAGAELPGGRRGQIAQPDLPGAHGTAGQGHGVRTVPVSHYGHPEGGNVQTGPELRRLLPQFCRPGVNTGDLRAGAEFDRSRSPRSSGARGEVGGPGRGQTARLGEISGGKQTVSLGGEAGSEDRKVAGSHVVSFSSVIKPQGKHLSW